MTEKEYSWNLIGESEIDPHNDLPDISIQRFALSHILIPFRDYPYRSITMINLHPDTWNALMLPYGGLRIDNPMAASGVKTFMDLSHSLHDLITDNLNDYLEGARRELSAYYSEVADLSEIPPLYRNYSLKFSKSANQWTAYVFTYHAAPISLLTAAGLQRAELRMKPASIRQALQEKRVEQTKLEENVVAILKSGIVEFWASSVA